jgi:serine/threonine-protein kinase
MTHLDEVMSPVTPADPRLARLASLLADRYEFQAVLGVGGSGKVYEVRHRGLGRREALKVLSETSQEPEAVERFTQEARIAATLDHPGIVRVHDFGMDGGIRWYTMQLMDGPSLATWIDQNLPLSQRDLASVAIPILEALEFSHGRGVVHRDIKPANILFDHKGHPRLADFGIAKSEGSLLKTQTGVLMGTPAYASPEQALGEAVDARSDQYSLGITL